MLFALPLSDVSFQRIEAFCSAFPEGVRVEYKSNLTQVAKVVSAFANTVGGVWIIGVQTDNANMPVLPITGIPLEAGLEERITQSSLMGVYPPITPQIKVIPIPTDPQRCIVFVRVFESIEAPHAIENTTRVYKRVASVKQPFALADIERIEFLFGRRKAPTERREELIRLAQQRSPFATVVPRIRVVLSPVYPHKTMLDLEAIYQAAERAASSPVKEDIYLVRLRRSQNALLSSRSGGVDHHHFELDRNGLFFLEVPLEIHRMPSGGDAYKYFRFLNLLFPPAVIIRMAQKLLHGQATNVMVRVEVFTYMGISLLPRDDIINPGWILQQTTCVDESLSAETQIILETLTDTYVNVVTELLRQISWAFNFTDVTPELVGHLLALNGLIPR